MKFMAFVEIFSGYLMRLLDFSDGQRLPLEKQTSALIEQMIRECQVLPCELAGQIEEQRAAAFVQNVNPYFKAANVRVNPALIKANAELLYPPAIEYARGDRVEPDKKGSEWTWHRSGRDQCSF
jgi:hypothetical protein